MSRQNKIILIGNISSDPVLRETSAGNSVARFNLTVEKPAAEGLAPQTDIIPIVTWGKNAEKSLTLKKNELVLIEGQIQTRTYDDEAGNRKWITEVDARDLKSLEQAFSGETIKETPISKETNTQSDNVFENLRNLNNTSLEEKTTISESEFDFEKQVDTKETKKPKENAPIDLEKELGEEVPF